ncbi:glycoside hydrolase family 127 protein [candidate division KSB1 bacterium]|nr:glycoside hydrolase family 127 protein [candidate division KSB1 bacterium]
MRARCVLFVCAFWSLSIIAYGQTERPIHDMGLISTSSSPNARLHDVPIRAVSLGDGFWLPRLQANQQHSIPELYQLLEQHGVIDNFRRLSGRKKVDRRGYLFTDSDLFKWMEAAALSLQSNRDDKVRALLDQAVEEVLAAQGEDGYLNTYHVAADGIQRFSNFSDNHELYCLGHLIQAGIAYFRGAGERKLLDAAIRYADYVLSLFGPDKRQCFPGHPEIEMALVELYRSTGEKKYLDFVGYLYSGIDLERLEEKVSKRHLQYTFSGIPFTERKELRSHAVRAMYACCGAADYYMETGDQDYWQTLQTLWRDMTQYKIYVTGGVGSRYSGEAFGLPYELPNERAYTETCAAIGAMMWNWRMLQATGDAKYADWFERGLYNGFLAGVSFSGTQYFYRNPLTSYGDTQRQPWYNCTCCPPNVERTLASIPGYMYSTSDEGIWVHLYHTSTLKWRIENGVPLTLKQETAYPWRGQVLLTVAPAKSCEFTVLLHIPEWAPGAVIWTPDGAMHDDAQPGTYYKIRRRWRKGDQIRMILDMPVRLIYANPRVREDFSSVAVMRGPIVYCLESIDHPGYSIFDLIKGPETMQTFTLQSETLLYNAVVLESEASLYQPGLETAPLYEYNRIHTPIKKVPVTFIPYYSWANRGRSQMQVWMPEKCE